MAAEAVLSIQPTGSDGGSQADLANDIARVEANAVGAASGAGATSMNDEEILEITPLPDNKHIKEVITLSSDSEDDNQPKPSTSTSRKRGTAGICKDEAGQDDDGDQDSLEIVQELPYSYMNRPRGPKPDFLRNLLQQTNREIQQGRKIADNIYHKVEPQFPVARASSFVRVPKQIQEVTLSSDEEEEAEEINRPEKTQSESSPSPVTRNANANSDRQVNATREETIPSQAEQAPAPVLASEVVEPAPGESSSSSDLGARSSVLNNRKRSHPNNELTGTSAMPKQSTSSLQRRRAQSPQKQLNHPMTSQAALALEKLLARQAKEIEKVGEEVVDFDDETNSAYLRGVKLNRACYKSYKLLCNMKNMSANAGRPINTPIKLKLSDGLAEFPEVVKAVEKFVNSRKKNFTPAYYQVKEVVEKTAQGAYPTLDEQNILSIAKTLFEDVMNKVRSKRVSDSLKNGYWRDLGPVFFAEGPSDDPALESPELAAKLEENARLRIRHEEEVQQKFVEVEDELKSLNPEALEEDAESLHDEESDEEMPDADADNDEEGKEPGENFTGSSDKLVANAKEDGPYSAAAENAME